MANLLPNVIHMQSEFAQATWQTIYMTLISSVVAGIFGLATGVFLIASQPGGILEDSFLYGLLDKVVNILRSIPFIILLAVIAPFTRYLVGTTIGTTAALVPLIIGIFPFYARQIQNALTEIDPGVVEAAEASGSSPSEIIFRVYLREGLPDIIRVSVVTIISLIGLTTMAGAIGSGGIGDIAISIGYARFENDVTIVAMIIILVMVFIVQFAGDWLAKHLEH